MTDYLVFQLYGTMAAWGETAVGEVRRSGAHPSRSAVLGLVAAALGIERDAEAAHAALASAYAMAVQQESAGVVLRDYHTLQSPASQRGRTWATRRDELNASTVNTMLTTRDYRCDAHWLIALWATGGAAPYALDALAAALRQPQFVLYLGRKACPPALPLQPTLVQAASLAEAFGRFPADPFRTALPTGEIRALYWPADAAAGMAPQQTVVRRDAVRHRGRWQFTTREEHMAPLPATHEE